MKKTAVRKLKTINLGEMYTDIFNEVQKSIAFNIYSEIGISDNISIMNDGNEIIKLSNADYDFNEITREVKKQLIKNNLLVIEIVEQRECLILNTNNDLEKLFYVSSFDEDNRESNELAAIKEELEQEKSSEYCWGKAFKI